MLEAEVAVLGFESSVLLVRDGKLVLMRSGMPRADEERGPAELELMLSAEVVPCSVSEDEERRLLCERSVSVPGADGPVEEVVVELWAPLRASRVPPGPLVKPVPRPPPAAMAAALKIAAALRPSRDWWRRSMVASRRPSTW